MNFKKHNMYARFNADELKIGSKVIGSDDVLELIQKVTMRNNGEYEGEVVDVSPSEPFKKPFKVAYITPFGRHTVEYRFLYLIENPVIIEEIDW